MTQFLDHIDTWPKCVAIVGVTIALGLTISYCFWCYINTFENSGGKSNQDRGENEENGG
jgi:hypothetical protein